MNADFDNDFVDHFVTTHLDLLPDAWRRKEAVALHTWTYMAFGFPVHFATNDPVLLEGARLSAGRYSRSSAAPDAAPLRLTFLLDRGRVAPPVPPDWPARLHYLASGPWLTIDAQPWGHGWAHLERREAVAVLSPALAEHPVFYSRFLADSFLLNLLVRNGLGQLHASCVYRAGRAVLLSAPHNSGKSTTAFRLVRSGYRLLSDGMTYVRVTPRGIELLGYPAGEVKLRLDMAAHFADLLAEGEAPLVREDRKMVYNLRKAAPEQVLEESIFPAETVLCLVERGGGVETTAEPVDLMTARLALFPEMAHYDDPAVVRPNLAAVEALLRVARLYRLWLGSDAEGIFQAIGRL